MRLLASPWFSRYSWWAVQGSNLRPLPCRHRALRSTVTSRCVMAGLLRGVVGDDVGTIAAQTVAACRVRQRRRGRRRRRRHGVEPPEHVDHLLDADLAGRAGLQRQLNRHQHRVQPGGLVAVVQPKAGLLECVVHHRPSSRRCDARNRLLASALLRASSRSISTRSRRPLPSSKGWIVSSHKCESAARTKVSGSLAALNHCSRRFISSGTRLDGGLRGSLQPT
jgi:hypothetical protein